MNNVYDKLWKLAKPYYEKGRPMDIDHVEWMMEDTRKVCEKEKLDESFLMPLVILHDVGYGEVPAGNPFNVDLRKEHMKKGEAIAEKILRELNYDEDKIKTIAYLVSIHDNWALGDDKVYNENIILGTLNDLDFIWMVTPKGFPMFMEILDKNRQEMIEYLENHDKLTRRPFHTLTAQKLFNNYMEDRKRELK